MARASAFCGRRRELLPNRRRAQSAQSGGGHGKRPPAGKDAIRIVAASDSRRIASFAATTFTRD